MLTQSIAFKETQTAHEVLENYFDELHHVFINILYQKKETPVLKICLVALLDQIRFLWNQTGLQSATLENEFNETWLNHANIKERILDFPPQNLKHCLEDPDIISSEWHQYSNTLFKKQLENSTDFPKIIPWCESIYLFYFNLAKIKRFLMTSNHQEIAFSLDSISPQKKIKALFEEAFAYANQVMIFPISISHLLLFLYPQYQAWNQLKSILSQRRFKKMESSILKNS